MNRPILLSVAQAAIELQSSEAYVRRLLLRQQLYGVKVGPVWAIAKDDLDSFKRVRRPPGRPRKEQDPSPDEVRMRSRMTAERVSARSDPSRRGHSTAG
jgi:hypothetical protein